MAEERRPRGALLHGDDFMWELRYYFLKGLEDTAQSAISELVKDIYPLYWEARGQLKDEEMAAIVRVRHEGGIIQTGATFVPFTPFASYRHLYEAMVTQQAEVNLDACLELSKALLDWARKYRISPEYWSSSRTWIFNSLMFALGSFHSRKDAETPPRFSMWSGVNKAPLPVTFTPTIELEWELTEESKAQFQERLKQEAKKQIKDRVDRAFAFAKALYEPAGFKAFEKPQLLERDMRWLVAKQCLRKDETGISAEYPYFKYRKKKKKNEDVGAGAVRLAIEARAKEIGLILQK